jgi:hypothetical protein
LAGALSFDEKIRQSAALLYFGSGCGMMKVFTCKPQRTIDASPAFMEYGLAKKIAT